MASKLFADLLRAEENYKDAKSAADEARVRHRDDCDTQEFDEEECHREFGRLREATDHYEHALTEWVRSALRK